MRVTTKIVFDLAGHVLEHEFYEYDGPVAACKGASGAQNGSWSGINAFKETLMANYDQTFGRSEKVLQSLRNAWTPILQKGPSQYGFSPTEDAAYRRQIALGRSQTQDSISAAYGNEAKALAESQAAVGGGNVPLPSGVQAEQTATLMSKATGAEVANDVHAAGENLGVTEAGYQTGRQLFDKASTGLSDVARLQAGLASTAMEGGLKADTQAFDQASAIQKLNAAASPTRALGGAVGMLAGGAASLIPGVGPIVGPLVGSAVSGLMGGGGGGDQPNFSGLFGGGGDYSSSSYFGDLAPGQNVGTEFGGPAEAPITSSDTPWQL